MERKLSVGDTLGETFSIYRQQAGVLLPVAFWLFLAVSIVEALFAGSLGLGLIALVISLAVATLYQGTVVGLVSDVQDGRRDNSAVELMRSVAPVVMPLIGAGILSGFGIVFGFVLLVVPGLYLLTIWAVIAPVIVVERLGVFDAFGRSRQLVRGSGWPVFWTVVASFLITFVAVVVFAAIAVALSEGILVEIVLLTLGATFTAPIPALVASVIYFRLLELRAEAPASDSSASAAAPEPPAAS
ncbi:MAG TPA: hypothetical protein VIT89_03695 [Solirubrobacterales bacterium]